MMNQYKLKQWLPTDKPKRIMVRKFASTEVLYEGIVYQIPHELMNRTVEFTSTFEDGTRIYIVSREED